MTRPLDGILNADDRHRYRVPKPQPKPGATTKRNAAQADRNRALVAQGLTVKRGANGLTVFNLGFAGQPFKSWDGHG